MNAHIDDGTVKFWQDLPEYQHMMLQLAAAQMRTGVAYGSTLFKYHQEFMQPFWTALEAFFSTEKEKLLCHPPADSMRDYFELLQFNLQVAEKGFHSGMNAMIGYHSARANEAMQAWLNTVFKREGDTIVDFTENETRLLETLLYAYPKAIRAIKPEYGFHFDDGGYVKAGETDRFLIYQVLPTNTEGVRKNGKPVLIVPPYVLGPNILAFLPGENKSYVHAYANQGSPTYIRILKDIDATPAVQTLTGEQDALDTRTFCEILKKRHGQPVTLNGFCQGGFVAMTGLLSGKLDGLVDALINCVAPMDGTRSAALVEYMQHLPSRFRDLGYAVKSLPNGNRVVDGKVMSWVYKLKSMEKEAPLYALYRDLKIFDKGDRSPAKISKTAAAINHWLIYDRNDLPEAITKMSFDSYTVPVDRQGNLPFKLFDRALNFKRLKEKNIPFLICYAEKDDLVDKEAALAPLDHIPAEVSCFPKGHGAIATSWSRPDSACALHTRFGDNYRGPVRFHLDLENGHQEKA
jgi:alpha-beta hydrolase superfamily lysophospholipase